jgi:hypothetical protein
MNWLLILAGLSIFFILLCCVLGIFVSGWFWIGCVISTLGLIIVGYFYFTSGKHKGGYDSEDYSSSISSYSD